MIGLFSIKKSATKARTLQLITLCTFQILQKNFTISGFAHSSYINETRPKNYIHPFNYTGLYMIVLHQDTGLAFRKPVRFKTYEIGNDFALLKELTLIQPGRIVILASLVSSKLASIDFFN